ncbi:hypothetical protein, partial [Streptomyces sp. NPDC059656]|uniref:hypothetical protein n=1 Tax=Streptomyces sp. NPDC059656 TaxID=3346898 RepID=UPI00369D478F
MAVQGSLLKTYGDRSYRHVTMARHQGTTIAFAMDASRRIVYSVLEAWRPGAGGSRAGPSSPTAATPPAESPGGAAVAWSAGLRG